MIQIYLVVMGVVGVLGVHEGRGREHVGVLGHGHATHVLIGCHVVVVGVTGGLVQQVCRSTSQDANTVHTHITC